MKIGPLDKSAPVAPVAGERTPASARQDQGQGQATVEDSAQVELSAAASLLGASASAEFDADKVQRIAQAIRDGRFEVNAEAIADKLIANAREVLGKAH